MAMTTVLLIAAAWMVLSTWTGFVAGWLIAEGKRRQPTYEDLGRLRWRR